MTNKQIKTLLSDLESTLVSQQNQINRNKFNDKYKNGLIVSANVKVERLEDENINLNEEIDEISSIVGAEDLTDAEKIKLIKNKLK